MPYHYLILSSILFGIGLLGVLLQRHIIKLLMCIEIMLNAVNLIFVAYAATYDSPEAQLMVFFMMMVAAAEVVIGLAIVVQLYRRHGSLDIDSFQESSR